jgi:hypothetical protein
MSGLVPATAARVVGVSAIVWHGTEDDALDLMNALARNCTCELGPEGERVVTCAAHQVIADQRALDRLLFARFIADRLRSQEWSEQESE